MAEKLSISVTVNLHCRFLALKSPGKHTFGCICEAISREVYLKRDNHPECGQHHFVAWDPRLDKRENELSTSIHCSVPWLQTQYDPDFCEIMDSTLKP